MRNWAGNVEYRAGRLLEPRSVQEAGVFDPLAVERLFTKCKANAGQTFSNADNMALVGVLSTQLLWWHFIRRSPERFELRQEDLTTVVDLGV